MSHTLQLDEIQREVWVRVYRITKVAVQGPIKAYPLFIHSFIHSFMGVSLVYICERNEEH
jgi:hypothetical protein